MDRLSQEALMRMLAYGALAINAPAPSKPLPFSVRLELMECIPSVRESVVGALAECLRHLKIDAVAATPGGARAVVPLLAHELKLRCVLPMTTSSDDYAAVMLYGPNREELSGLKVAIVQEFARNANPLERMANALWSARCEVRHVVTLLDADRDGRIVRWIAANPSIEDYRSLISAPEVFLALRQDPTFSGLVEPEVLAAAETCYKTASLSLRPDTGTRKP